MKLQQVYPDIGPERIIAGTVPVAGITPQDWLNAAIVSMGSMGVVYSMVLEVVPQFGVREVVVQKTWEDICNDLNDDPVFDPIFQGLDFETKLRFEKTAEARARDARAPPRRGAERDRDPAANKRYADLAINPNRDAKTVDYECWIGNREVTGRLPMIPSRPPGARPAT